MSCNHRLELSGASLLLVTHSDSAAARASRVLRLTPNGLTP